MAEKNIPSEFTLKDRAEAWSNYWNMGAAWSCMDLGLEDSSSEAFVFWQSALGELTAADHILEIGAGNGNFVDVLRRIFSPQTVPPYLGVDLADIRPKVHATEGEQIQFRGEIDIANTDIENQSFTTAISQFCLEYTPLDQSITEISRILVPKGATLAMIMHHAESKVTLVAKEEIRYLKLILADDGILQSAKNMIPFVLMASTPEGKMALKANPDAQTTRSQFNQKQDELQSLAEAAETSPILHHAAKSAHDILVATSQYGEQQALSGLEQAHTTYQDALLRLQELVDTAMGQSQIESVKAILNSNGFTSVDISEVSNQDQRMGWTVLAKR